MKILLDHHSLGVSPFALGNLQLLLTAMISKIVSKLRIDGSAKQPKRSAGPNVDLLLKANADLATQLGQANQEIQTLHAKLAELDCLLAHTQARRIYVSEPSLSPPTTAVRIPCSSGSSVALMKSREGGDFEWIDNVWICTHLPYLHQAEQSWRDGDVVSALDQLQDSLWNNPFLSVAESVHARVMLAAILYAQGEYQKSLGQVNYVVELALSCEKVQGINLTDLVDLAHFIEGMNLMELGCFERAYWSYLRSLQLPGYSSRKHQIRAIEEFTHQQATDDNVWDNRSLRPVISSDQLRPMAVIGGQPYDTMKRPEIGVMGQVVKGMKVGKVSIVL